MNVIRQSAGNTMIEWQEDEPLRWEMSETRGKGKHALETTVSFDLTPLSTSYSHTFLLGFKEVLVNMRLRIAIKSIKQTWYQFSRVALHCQNHFAKVCEEEALARVVFERIDADFLLGLSAIKDEVPSAYLRTLRTFFTENHDNAALFSPDLLLGDFPIGSNDQGHWTRLRQNVLSSAMSRSVLVEILNVTEAAFEIGELSMARYAFSRLMLSRAARPETYRLLRCKDLRVDISGGVKSYFLTLTIPKARTAIRPLATVSIHREVGQLLEKQREAVARRLTYLVESKNATFSNERGESSRYTIGDLPLFPVVREKQIGEETASGLGMYPDRAAFTDAYVKPLKKLTGKRLTCTAMRHTMATQLAISGCSAGTIAAVLLHATTNTARVYVDLIFEGVIDELSDSMEGAFIDHFPVFKDFVSTKDLIEPESRIVSHSADRMRRETTGACGRRRICEYAPLSCYDCHRFKPAYDADHNINLHLVTEEIDSAREGGLQRQIDVKRYSHIANRIRIVINVCELKRAANESERANGGC